MEPFDSANARRLDRLKRSSFLASVTGFLLATRAACSPEKRPAKLDRFKRSSSDRTLKVAAGMFSGGKATLSGLIRLLPQPNPSGQVYVTPLPRAPFTPGTVIWVRVRTVGLKGVMGGWSDPAQIRVG